MTGPAFKDHFSERSADYAASRPTYPPQLARFLAEHSPRRGLALDCGCGTGQLSLQLAEHFDRVVATDASAQQIAAATPHPCVEYRAAPAEASCLPAASADLVVAAQAAHWFDLPAFYAEAKRVGRPGALLALVTYGIFHVEGDAERLIHAFYWNTLGPFWPAGREHVENGYRSLPFPYAEIEAPSLAIELAWTRAELLAYIDTWSAMRAAEKAIGRQPFDDLAGKLAEDWPDGERRLVRWPLSIRAGHIAQRIGP
jgi:SAM-dependent methyltransferase